MRKTALKVFLQCPICSNNYTTILNKTINGLDKTELPPCHSCGGQERVADRRGENPPVYVTKYPVLCGYEYL